MIASSIYGSQEQLGDAAMLVDPGKPDEIANAVVELYGNPALRKKLIEAGNVRAKRWTGLTYTKTMIEFFDEFSAVRKCWPQTSSKS